MNCYFLCVNATKKDHDLWVVDLISEDNKKYYRVETLLQMKRGDCVRGRVSEEHKIFRPEAPFFKVEPDGSVYEFDDLTNSYYYDSELTEDYVKGRK